MPWTASEATHSTKKAKTPKLKRQWSKVANSVRRQGLSAGLTEKKASAKARIEANGVIARHAFR